MEHRAQHRDQQGSEAVRRRPRAPSHPDLRRERQVPRHVHDGRQLAAVLPLHLDRREYLGRRRRDAADPQVRLERELPVRVGLAWRRAGTVLGPASVDDRSGRQSLCCGGLQRAHREVPPEAERGSGEGCRSGEPVQGGEYQLNGRVGRRGTAGA